MIGPSRNRQNLVSLSGQRGEGEGSGLSLRYEIMKVGNGECRKSDKSDNGCSVATKRRTYLDWPLQKNHYRHRSPLQLRRYSKYTFLIRDHL